MNDRTGDMIVIYLIDEFNHTYYEDRAKVKDRKEMKRLLEELEIKGINLRRCDWFD